MASPRKQPKLRSSRVHPLPGTAEDALRSPSPALLPQRRANIPVQHQESQSSHTTTQSIRGVLSTSSSGDSEAEPCLISRMCLRSSRVLFHCLPDTVQSATGSSNQAEESCRKTHYLSTFITKAQCFLMPTSISIEESFPSQAEGLRKILGICVQFKTEKCDLSCNPCRDCGVCSHLYTCSCPDFYKYRGTLWCAHIHAMHSLTKGRFKEKACLYIHTDHRYMLVHHVMALIQGEEFMKPQSPGSFEERVDNFDVSSKYKVQVENEQNSCTCSTVNQCSFCEGCRCRYSCSCPDFKINGHVCQHIHSVAMLKQENSFLDFELPELKLIYSMAVMHDRNLKHYVQLEHEMSFYIKWKSIAKQKGPPPKELDICNIVEFSTQHELSVRNVDSESEGSFDTDEYVPEDPNITDSWWIIRRKSTSMFKKKEECRVRSNFYRNQNCICRKKQFSIATSCSRCKICFRHYTCNCSLDCTIICRHIHAVHRMLTNATETEKEAERYIKQNFPLAVRNNYLRKSVENLPPSFRKEDSPGPSRQMDILPPPTD